jgi:hypothetical protein
MKRLTRPNLNVDPDTDRFLHATIGGKEIDWKQSRDSTLNVLINGPTSNGFGKDIFRKMARDLYGRLKAYEDIGLTPEEIKAPFTEDAMINLAAQALGVETSRLRELAEADKDGRVVVLPCKVGDILYRVFAGEIFEHRVGSMKYFAIQGRWDIETYPFCPCVESSIGKTIFLNHKEAEKALREIQGKEDADGATDKPE